MLAYIGWWGGFPLLFSVIEFAIALECFLVVYWMFRETRTAPMRNASLAFLALIIASGGILLRRVLSAGAEPPFYMYFTDFGYLFTAIFLYKAMVK